MENKNEKTVLDSARERAQNITETAKEQYKIELEKLKLFNARFSAFVNATVKNYPCDKTRKLVATSEMLTEILSRDEVPFYTAKDKIEDVYTLIEDKDFSEVVNEQKPSLFGKSDNGFDMEEVLNPKGDLDLSTLLKELGVTD